MRIIRELGPPILIVILALTLIAVLKGYGFVAALS